MKLYKFNDSTLQWEDFRTKTNFRTPILVAIVFLIMGFSSALKFNTVIERVPVILQHREEECDTLAVRRYIATLNLRFPKIVYQQVMLESAWLTSPIYRQFNNMTGMQVATARPTTGKDVGNRFASYESWKECLLDYALWQAAYTSEIKTEADYYYFLDKVYCEPTGGIPYSQRLKQIPYESPGSS